MDQSVLVQYSEVMEEIKDLRERIRKLDRFLSDPPIVSDTVRGTRKDGTIGPIKITGIPVPEYQRKEKMRDQYREMLEEKEAELLELTCKAEEYIESIPKAEIRIMFRLYYIDGLTWEQVARQMNRAFPKKRISYTADSCRMRAKRFFAKFYKCSPMFGKNVVVYRLGAGGGVAAGPIFLIQVLIPVSPSIPGGH